MLSSYLNMAALDRANFLLNGCLIVVETMDKSDFILRIQNIIISLISSIKNKNFSSVSNLSKELEGDSDFNSIHVISSYIFENDHKNEQKLMFILEFTYRSINILYINGYALDVDSFFREEPVDNDIDVLCNLIQEFDDVDILNKFEKLFIK